jgi:hypothetical protein
MAPVLGFPWSISMVNIRGQYPWSISVVNIRGTIIHGTIIPTRQHWTCDADFPGFDGPDHQSKLVWDNSACYTCSPFNVRLTDDFWPVKQWSFQRG